MCQSQSHTTPFVPTLCLPFDIICEALLRSQRVPRESLHPAPDGGGPTLPGDEESRAAPPPAEMRGGILNTDWQGAEDLDGLSRQVSMSLRRRTSRSSLEEEEEEDRKGIDSSI